MRQPSHTTNQNSVIFKYNTRENNQEDAHSAKESSSILDFFLKVSKAVDMGSFGVNDCSNLCTTLSSPIRLTYVLKTPKADFIYVYAC